MPAKAVVRGPKQPRLGARRHKVSALEREAPLLTTFAIV